MPGGPLAADPTASSGTYTLLGADTDVTVQPTGGPLAVRWRRDDRCGPVTVTVGEQLEAFDVGERWQTDTLIENVSADEPVTVSTGDCTLLVDHLTDRMRPWSTGGLYTPDLPDAIVDAVAAGGPDASLAATVSATPTAVWLTGADAAALAANTVANARELGQVPVLVMYARPNRDCGGESAGGVAGEREYLELVDAVGDAIADTPTIVIVEPDAASQDCTSSESIAATVDALSEVPGAFVYLDAGHPGWLPFDEQVERLQSAGVSDAAGVAVNVSNFASPDDAASYGRRLVDVVGGGYVTDTSRAGAAVADGDWCNPMQARVGPAPDVEPADPRHDAQLWVKRPGESDGECQGGPPAGIWWPEGAARLNGQT